MSSCIEDVLKVRPSINLFGKVVLDIQLLNKNGYRHKGSFSKACFQGFHQDLTTYSHAVQASHQKLVLHQEVKNWDWI